MSGANDKQIVLIYERSPDAYSKRVNDLLAEGNWRIASSHAYPIDSDFFAMLIQRVPEPIKAEDL